jgi:acyl-CoA thioester hydrolase
MYCFETKTRITYSDTDKMGYSYYGNYPTYYEIGRTELMRSLNLSYRFFEESGIMMPVVDMHIRYYKPVFYDDMITIRASVEQIPTSRIVFKYEIFNEKNELCNEGTTDLAFIDYNTRKPMRAPQNLVDALNKHFE